MKVLPVMEAIRQRCLFCRTYSTHNVDHCGIRSCTLWPYRMGQNPKGYTDIHGDRPTPLGTDGLPALQGDKKKSRSANQYKFPDNHVVIGTDTHEHSQTIPR